MSTLRAALFSFLVLGCAALARDVRTVAIDGHPITYEDSGGLAVVQGDIIIGATADVAAAAAGGGKQRASAVYLDSTGSPAPWTNATIYYTIDTNLPDPQRIRDAIDYWNAHTPLTLAPRVGQLNYVRFIHADASRCASSAGMVGGVQYIQAGADCSAGAIIHEIGHAAGLLHEQARHDRDQWVTVLYENIDRDFSSQFHTGPDVRDDGYYDYDSIMHYSARSASIDGSLTIETVPPGIPIGQLNGLSAGDIDSIRRLYGIAPATTTVTTMPAGLMIHVDGESYQAPHEFNWGPGSSHTVSVDEVQSTDPRYRFVRWTDGGAAAHTITVAAGQTVYAAEFQQENHFQAGVASGSGAVSVFPASPDGYYPAGTALRMQANADAGGQFVAWSGTDLELSGNGHGASPAVLSLFGSWTFLANFSADPVTTIASDPPGLTVRIDDVEYLTPARFGWTAGSEHTLSLASTQLSRTAAIRYRFTGWEDGAISAARTVTAGDSTTFTAAFRSQYYLSLDHYGAGLLSTSPLSSDGYFDAGTQVTVNAVPAANQTVQYWLGDVGGGGESKTFVMDQHRSAYAVFGPAPNFRAVSAASYLANGVFDEPGNTVAPLEIVTLYGSNLGPDTLAQGVLGADGRLSTSVAGTQVMFDTLAAPILYASATQTSVVVPAGIAGRSNTNIVVLRNGASSGFAVATVGQTLPGLFTADSSGRGPVAAVNEDGSPNSAERPAAPGSVVVLYATGAGLMDRAVTDGALAGADLAHPQAPLSVRIGGLPATVLYAGSAPGLVNGAIQVNVRVPEELLSGPQTVHLVVGDWSSPPGTTLSVE